ncbi:hypothetical protein I79_015911 [Cricetulus griseus]|uniref:Uncharacterized protein n=1 Tax=Cricetulus griseus TaxID=10029 RepID=G3HXZ5_CRIGR|nr:hypothetical protein I79_015911 [Cricetulus griseus]
MTFSRTGLNYSSSPPHTQREKGVHQLYVDTLVREEQGGAEWAWSFVPDTPHL